MKRYLPLSIALLLIVTTGVVHGMRTGRWRPSTDVANAVTRMATMPMSVGDWEGEELELKGEDPPGVAGHLCRRYVHRRTGHTISMYVVCGRPGPVAIHTPDVCYGASGFTVGAPLKFATPGGDADFWTADMARTTAADRTRTRVFWSWSSKGAKWVAADSPRITFAAEPVLFKIYVLREMTSEGEQSLDNDPCVEWMRDVLPVLGTALCPAGDRA
jgi:hypothetical protein